LIHSTDTHCPFQQSTRATGRCSESSRENRERQENVWPAWRLVLMEGSVDRSREELELELEEVEELEEVGSTSTCGSFFSFNELELMLLSGDAFNAFNARGANRGT
jgi:hypothetical protein